MSNKKVILSILTVFLVIGFSGTSLFAQMPPLEKYQGPIKPGLVITKDNWDQYLPELKKLLPASKLIYNEFGVKEGGITIPIVEYSKKYPGVSPAWREASFKHQGTASIDPKTHELLNWQGGNPFPHPKNCSELLWNSYTLYNRTAGGHDDHRFYATFNLFDKNKYQKRFSWVNQERRYLNRVEMPPFGNLEPYRKDGIVFKGTIMITEPQDVRGFILLRHKYWDMTKPDDVFSYIPALKRIRRLTGGDLTDPLLGSDAIPDDFQVFQQKITPEMTWRMVAQREMFYPQFTSGWLEENPDMRPKYDMKKTGVGFPEKLEIRPAWIWEVSTNNPDYVYSKRVLYTNAVPLEETPGSFMIFWGENYDQAGRLWRSNGYLAIGVNPLGFHHLFGYLFADAQKSHYSLMDGWSSIHSKKEFSEYLPLDEGRALTIQGLLREAR